MKIAIMQPYFMPYTGYWQLIGAVDTFIIFDDVTFIKKGWINRNQIIVNKKPWMFTVPLKNPSQNVFIRDLRVGDNINFWREKFLKTVADSYKRAPYFDQTFVWLEKCAANKSPFFIDWLSYSLIQLSEMLSIKTKFKRSSEMSVDNSFKGQDKILAICGMEQARTYINPINGQSIYDRNAFARQNIKLFFLSTNNLEYPQFNLEFIPYLSIIDVLMFNSTKETKKILSEYQLI